MSDSQTTTTESWKAKKGSSGLRIGGPGVTAGVLVGALVLGGVTGGLITRSIMQEPERDTLASRGLEYGIVEVLSSDTVRFAGDVSVSGSTATVDSTYSPDRSNGFSSIEVGGRNANVYLAEGRLFVDNVDGVIQQLHANSDAPREVVEVDAQHPLMSIFPNEGQITVPTDEFSLDDSVVTVSEEPLYTVTIDPDSGEIQEFSLSGISATKFSSASSMDTLTVPPTGVFVQSNGSTQQEQPNPEPPPENDGE